MQTDKKPIYPVEPWTITEPSFEIENNYRNETTFALSNGYIGTRGTFEEAYPFDLDTGLEGNFINGFYEREQIRYGEANFGSPLLSQSLLNLPNLKETHVALDGEVFDMREGTMENYSRILYMRDGLLERKLVWTSPSGKKAAICIKRLVSFARKNIMAMRYEVTPLNFDGEIRFTSRLQADVENHTRKTNPIVDYGPFGRKLEPVALRAEGARLYYEGITQTSKLTVGCGSLHRVFIGKKAKETAAEIEGIKDNGIGSEAELSVKVQGKTGTPIILEKMICYTSDLDRKAEKLAAFVQKSLDEAEELGYDELERLQKAYMHSFWETADVEINEKLRDTAEDSCGQIKAFTENVQDLAAGEKNAALQQGLRFNLFHVFQSAGRDGRTGMGAKGLSGEGYEGHYFWDTEMYIMPVLTYTQPEVVRKLLEYRYHTLPQARDRARVLGHSKGALFPWRTINGEEASTYYPLGTAQYHIIADIEYALALYLQVTGDVKFFREMGAEILIDTARIWADVGSFAQCKGGKYCICDVTGPDEYNVLVDNNFYTNFMAREHLRDAVKAVEYLQEKEPEVLQRLCAKLDFNVEETVLWKKIVDNMYFPYDEARQVYPMDDGFMMRKPWDESKIPPEKRAWLYENYHPLFIMRHRMSKQADAIIAMYLHSNQFGDEELRRNYDFYQEVTLHHSSLSTCIFGIVACDIGARLHVREQSKVQGVQEKQNITQCDGLQEHLEQQNMLEEKGCADSELYFEEAYKYFSQSARMDLDDYHNNFYAGIHAANMAGTWQALVNGFAGLRCFDGKLYFRPYLPKEWDSYRFHLRFRDCVLRVEIWPDRAQFKLLKGENITFAVNEHTVVLTGSDNICEIKW